MKLYIEWSSCRVKDYVAVPRCYKCQSLGHIGKFCKKDKETCSHCATEGHGSKTCPNIDKFPICANCKKLGKDPNHKVNDSKCSAYLKAIQQQIDRTDYEF